MGAPGTLPNGRHIPLPPGQQMPPETTPQQQTPPQPELPPVSQAGLPPTNQAGPVSASAMPATPTAPSLLDQPAQPATVTLSGRRLSVAADNSSLSEILHQLAVSSGMTIDGLDKDTRVFGTYGPGNPRDILNQLLDGAGYNVMMVGNTPAGTPRQLVLAARSNAPLSQPQASRVIEREDDQDDNEPLNSNPAPDDMPPHPPADAAPPPSGQSPNGNPRTPQQILQDLQQMRQQQQQQYQQQQQQPQQQPNPQ
jgi:hypothetical protein